MTTPCSVFMTFENEEGYQRACAFDKAIDNDSSLADCKKWAGDHEIEVQEASEPSDIIWENRHFTPTQRFKKELVVCGVMILMLVGSFCLIFYCSNVSAAALGKYPPIADCSTSLINYDDDAFMQQAAILEYRTNTALEAQGKTVSYSGYVQCFCNDKQAEGAEPDAVYG